MIHKRLVAMGLLMALTATGAIADTQHYATAPTEKEAKRLATAGARATARETSSCYRPARQVGECVAVDGGFRCRADTSISRRVCRHAGWVNEFTAAAYADTHHDPWRTVSGYSSWPGGSAGATNPGGGLYGRPAISDPGPPAPTPFPPN